MLRQKITYCHWDSASRDSAIPQPEYCSLIWANHLSIPGSVLMPRGGLRELSRCAERAVLLAEVQCRYDWTHSTTGPFEDGEALSVFHGIPHFLLLQSPLRAFS